MKKVTYIKTFDEVVGMIEKATSEYLTGIEGLIALFESEDVQLVAKPCYFYDKKFETTYRQKGARVFIRIKLYPKELSLAQAQKTYYVKEFFSKKLIHFSKTDGGFIVQSYDLTDKAVMRFLEKHLQKVRGCKSKGIPITQVLQESLDDLFRSWIYATRYCSEAKTSCRGKSLMWLIIVLIFIIGYLAFHARREFLRP